MKTPIRLLAPLLFLLITAGTGCSEEKEEGGKSPASGSGDETVADEKARAEKAGDAESDGPAEIAKLDPAQGLTLAKTHCNRCHDMPDSPAMVPTGQRFDATYVQNQLDRMRAYDKQVATVKERYPDKYASSKDAFEHILAAEEPRVRFVRWLPHYAQNPTFDRRTSVMNALGYVQTEQLQNVAAWILTLEAK